MYKIGDILKCIETGETLMVTMVGWDGIRFFNLSDPIYTIQGNLETFYIHNSQVTREFLLIDNALTFADKTQPIMKGEDINV